ncbi:MAG: transcription termination/antitermination protein NusG, partial [Clostridia bacterium]|nr:transcription termination/antitermination protein NusG [Clostridia bacterium]
MSEQNNAKWYILHTYSGYESLVKKNIEQMVENGNLQDVI